MSEHSKGKLTEHKYGVILGGPLVKFVNGETQVQIALAVLNESVDDGTRNENSRRIVACWNAFDGVRTEQIEKQSAADRFAIVNSDNFGSDYPAEFFVATAIPNKELAKVMCDALNEKLSSNHASRYYKVVAADYELLPGFEP